MLAPLLSLSLAISSPEVTYIGWDHVLLHHPTTGTYTIQHYARYSRPPCVGLAGEPRFIGNVGMLGQRFVALGKGTLLQLDPVKGSFALRQCSTADRLALGLRIACPVVLEGQPQAAFANVSLLAATDDVLLVHNTSQLSTATLRGYRIRRGAGFTPAGAFGFEKLKLAGLVWRESFGRHALTPMGKQLVFDYESEAPSHFRIWRLNPSCAAGKPCNSATDPPLQGPLHEGTFPHAGRAFVGLSHDAPDDVSVLHLMELDPASATYRVLVCDSARLGGHDAPLPCSYYQSRTPLLQPSPCMARADRASCLAHEGCGWCASASVCLLGNEVSPCSGGCPPEAWVGREPDTNATRSQPGEWDPRPAGAHVVGASASDAGVAPRLLDGGGELSVRLAMAAPFGASSLAVSSTVGLGVGSLVRLSPGTDAEEDHVVGQLSDDGRLQLLGSTWHAQPQGAGVALLAAGDPSVLERLRDGLMPTATAIAAAANPNATDAGVAAVETLVYLGGDSVLQLLPQGQYALWKLARPGVESRAPSGVTRAPPRNGFEEAPAAQGLLPAPRLATGTPAAQLVFTGAASCGGVTDDGCDTFVAFEAASGRYFRFQRRPSQASPTALAALGVGGAYELKAQGSWPTMASRQLLYVGHNVLWAWSAELCDLRAYRYKSHRQRGANASASVGEVGGAAEAAVFMGAWRLPADLKGESLTFLRTMPDDGLVVSYDPHAPPPVKARVWLPTPRADDGASSGGGGGGGTGRPLQAPALLSVDLWSAAPRQLVGLHSGLLLEHSLGGGRDAYTLHGLAPNGSAMVAVARGRLGGSVGGDARVCAHDGRTACVRDLRCGYCHATSRCVLTPTAQAGAAADAAAGASALGSDADEECPDPATLEIVPPAALAVPPIGARRLGWRAEHALSLLSPTGPLLQWSPTDGVYQLWSIEGLGDGEGEVGSGDSTGGGGSTSTCPALLPLGSGQWARAGVHLLPFDAGTGTEGAAGGGQQLLLEHHRGGGSYRLLMRLAANASSSSSSSSSAAHGGGKAAAAQQQLAAQQLVQRQLPEPRANRTLVPLGGGVLLDVHPPTGGYRVWALCVQCALAGHDPLPQRALLYETPSSSLLREARVAALGNDELLVYRDARHDGADAPRDKAAQPSFYRYVRGTAARTAARIATDASPLQPSGRAPPQLGELVSLPRVVGIPGAASSSHLLVVDGESGDYQLQRCAPPTGVHALQVAGVPVEGLAARLDATPPAPVCTPLDCPRGCGSLHSPPCDHPHHDACVADASCGWCASSSRCLPGDAVAPCASAAAASSATCGAWEHQQQQGSTPGVAAVAAAVAVAAADAPPVVDTGPTAAAAARSIGCAPRCLGRVQLPPRQLVHLGDEDDAATGAFLLEYRWAAGSYTLLRHSSAATAPSLDQAGASSSYAPVLLVDAYDRSRRRVVRHSDEVWDANASAAVCDVFEYTRPTRGLWRLFEPPIEPGAEQWSACARQRAPLLVPLGKRAPHDADELLLAVDVLSGRVELFACSAAALRRGVGPDKACPLVSRGLLRDWRCSDRLASLGRGRVLQYDTHTGDYVVLELSVVEPAAAAAAAAGDADDGEAEVAWREVTWGSLAELVDAAVLPLRIDVVLLQSRALNSYTTWLYNREAHGGCAPQRPAPPRSTPPRRVACAWRADHSETARDAGFPDMADAPRVLAPHDPLVAAGPPLLLPYATEAQPTQLMPEAATFTGFGANRLLAYEPGRPLLNGTRDWRVRVWSLSPKTPAGPTTTAATAATAAATATAGVKPPVAVAAIADWSLVGAGSTGVAPCQHSSCGECTAQPGCGWCAERHACMQGGDDGPCASDECSAALWMAHSCTASGVACGMFSACADCALNDDCGWCGGEARCVADAERLSTCSGPDPDYIRDTQSCDVSSAV